MILGSLSKKQISDLVATERCRRFERAQRPNVAPRYRRPRPGSAADLFPIQGRSGGGRIGGRVNSDPIGANLWGKRRRVTVHDQFSVLRLTGQERVSDSQEIIAILAIKRHPRPYAGMAEKVVADSVEILSLSRKCRWRSGKTAANAA